MNLVGPFTKENFPDLPNDTMVVVSVKGYYYTPETVSTWYTPNTETMAVCLDKSDDEDGQYEPTLIDYASIVSIEAVEPDEPPVGSVVLANEVAYQRLENGWCSSLFGSTTWDDLPRPIKILYVNE
jgi:hypothetical protein